MATASRATISFQYMEAKDEKPSAGYEVTDVGIDLPPGAHVPRVGELVNMIPSGLGQKFQMSGYVVLAVNTVISRDPNDHRVVLGWHTVVTVGPESEFKGDERLTIIRE